MSKLNLMFIGTGTIVAFALSACATPNTAQTTDVSTAVPTVTKTTQTGEVGSVDTKTEASQVAESTKELDPNRRVCKRQAVVGSNMKKRVCATAAVWEEEAARGRAAASKIQDGFRSQGGSN